MCQLLGMNAAEPTSFSFSFRGFAKRGGCSDKHCDGWGLAFYEGRGLRCFTDPAPAAHSPIAALVEQYPMKTYSMMAHIRYATQGSGGTLENVHPFSREMWGIQWCFCHNGDVPKFSKDDYPGLGKAKDQSTDHMSYNPVGDTDSEAVFCAILNSLKAEFLALPTLPVLHETLQRLCCEIVQGFENETIFNFLLGCGQYTLFAFSWPGSRPNSSVWNGLYYTLRRPPFTTASLIDCNYTMDFSKTNKLTDAVAVIATKPLTKDEVWIEVKRGELILFDKGLPYTVPTDCQKIEKQGRGLKTKCKSMQRIRDAIKLSPRVMISKESSDEEDDSSLKESEPNQSPIIVADITKAMKVLHRDSDTVSRLIEI